MNTVVKNATTHACGLPEPNQDATLLALYVVLFGFQTVFFVLRMLNRAVRMAPWGLDDTTIVIPFVRHPQAITFRTYLWILIRMLPLFR